MAVKNYCEIHHLYYKGDVCPLCLAEKHNNLLRKNTKSEGKNEKKDEQVTDEMLDKLKKHFGK